MPRVVLTFTGENRGALGAARQVSASLGQVKASAAGAATSQGHLSRETTRVAAASRQADRDLGKLSRGALAGSGAFRGLGRSIAFASAGFLGGYGLAAAARGAFGELEAGIKAGAQTQATLKSTGAVAGVTAKEIDRLAESRMRLTGVDDEAIKQAENWLLTFRQVRNERGKGNDIFKQATDRTLDLARAQANLRGTEIDLASASNLIGKALNDPIRGMTALNRVGVTFNEQQRAQIKGFMKTGDIMSAQKVILAELNAEVGGSAKAYGVTLPGAISRARETLRNLSASLLTGLTPAFKDGIARLQEWIDTEQKSGDLQRKFNTVVEDGTQVFKGIVAVIRTAAPVVQDVVDKMGGFKTVTEALIALKLASVLYRWTGALAVFTGAEAGAAAGTGLLGASAAAKALRTRLLLLTRMAPILIPIGIAWGGHKLGVNEWVFNNIIRPIEKAVTLGKYDPGPLYPKAAPGALPSGVGLAVPTSFKSTHQTTGLAGFPAVDLFASAGAPVLAPENGTLTRTSGADPSMTPAGFKGYSLYFVGDETGNTYFMTHLAAVAPLGYYRRGDVIATLAAGTAGGAHAHVGIHKGVSPAAFNLSTSAPPSPFGKGSRFGMGPKYTPHDPNALKPPAKKPPKAPKVDVTALSDPLRLKIAQAGATAGLADDIIANEAAVKFLRQKLEHTTNTGVKADLQEAINGFQASIKDARGKLAAASKEAGARLTEETGIASSFKTARAAAEKAFRLDLLPASEEAKLKTQITKFGDLVRKVARDGKITPAELAAVKSSWGAMSTGLDDAAQAVADNLKASAERKWAGITASIARTVSERWQLTERDFGRATSKGVQAISDKAAADIAQMSRDFQTQMDAFERATQAGLKALEVTQTAEERALADRLAGKTAADMTGRLADLTRARDDALAAEKAAQDALGPAGRSRGAESLATYNARVQAARDALTQATATRVGAEKALQAELFDEETAGYQARADASRTAADAKTAADQDAYQAARNALAQSLAEQESARENARQATADADALAYQDQRNAQWQALQNLHDDQVAALQADLDNWAAWIGNKQRTYAEFLAWLARNPVSKGLGGVGPDPFSLAPPVPAAGFYRRPHVLGKAGVGGVQFAGGGTVPGSYVGVNDSVIARVTPGEEIIDRSLAPALRRFLANPGAYGGGGQFAGATFHVYGTTKREVAAALKQLVDGAPVPSSYRSSRG